MSSPTLPHARKTAPTSIRYHDVMVALAEARAAAFILDDLNHGTLEELRKSSLEEEREAAGWLCNWVVEALKRTLAEAEAAFMKSQAGKKGEAA